MGVWERRHNTFLLAAPLKAKRPLSDKGESRVPLVFLKTAADTRLVFREGFKILHNLFFLKKQITRLTLHMLLISGGLFTNWLLLMRLPLSVSPDEIQDSLVTEAGQLLRTMTFQITFSFLSCSENGEGCQRAMWGWMRARIVIYIYDLTERWKQRECYSVLFPPTILISPQGCFAKTKHIFYMTHLPFKLSLP